MIPPKSLILKKAMLNEICLSRDGLKYLFTNGYSMTDSLLISRNFTYLLGPEELDLCQGVVVLCIILPLFPLRIITIREHA